MTKNGGILEITKREQYHTVDELFKRSQPNSSYYTLLVLSSLIIASGLLLGNNAVVIGGMIITPVLSPILLIALGIATGRLETFKGVSVLIAKSFLIISGSAIILAMLFEASPHSYIFDNTMRSVVLYFIVAVASGIAATFGWTRKEIADVLPGIAIAVSLVPPISMIGIGLATLSSEIARFYILVLLFNFIGIVGGSLAAFSLLKFSRAEEKVGKSVKELEKNLKEKK